MPCIVVKKKGLFDDKTEEINSLTVAVKDDITYINSELEKLEVWSLRRTTLCSSPSPMSVIIDREPIKTSFVIRILLVH